MRARDPPARPTRPTHALGRMHMAGRGSWGERRRARNRAGNEAPTGAPPLSDPTLDQALERTPTLDQALERTPTLDQGQGAREPGSQGVQHQGAGGRASQRASQHAKKSFSGKKVFQPKHHILLQQIRPGSTGLTQLPIWRKLTPGATMPTPPGTKSGSQGVQHLGCT